MNADEREKMAQRPTPNAEFLSQRHGGTEKTIATKITKIHEKEAEEKKETLPLLCGLASLREEG